MANSYNRIKLNLHRYVGIAVVVAIVSWFTIQSYVYNFSSTQEVYPTQTAMADQVVLDKNTLLSQTFTTDFNGLERIDIAHNPASIVGIGNIEISLISAKSQTAFVSLEQLRNSGTISVVTPLEYQAQTHIEIQMRIVDGSIDSAISIYVQKNNILDRRGETLTKSKIRSNAQLVFKPYYHDKDTVYVGDNVSIHGSVTSIFDKIMEEHQTFEQSVLVISALFSIVLTYNLISNVSHSYKLNKTVLMQLLSILVVYSILL